jgi:uroporphyrinogen-III synthase
MEEEDLSRLLSDVMIACIGPIAAETAEQMGLPVHVVAKPYTVQGLLHALADYIKE